MSHIVFNPPPGWPPAPQGWLPPVGWVPPSDWPAAPDGWDFLLELPESASVTHANAYDPHPAYGVRPARKPVEQESRDSLDSWFPGEEEEDRRFAAAQSRRHTLIIMVLVTLATLLAVSFFVTASNDPAGQAMNACGQAVRAAVAEQNATDNGVNPSAAAPRIGLPQGGNTFNGLSGDTSAFTIEGVHTTAAGETWTFSCLVDATTTPPVVLETNVVPAATVAD